MDNQRTDALAVGGGLTMHLPAARPFTPSLLGDIEFAMIAAAEGFPDIAKGVIIAFEERLGVTDFDRIQHGDVEAKARRLGGLARKLAERRAAAPMVTRPAPILGATPAEMTRLEKANRRIAKARTARDRPAIMKAADYRDSVLHDMDRRDSAAYVAGRAEELGQLEALRGGSVVMEELDIEAPVLDEFGAPKWRRGRKVTRRERVSRPRVTNRDGLKTLATPVYDADGKITRKATITAAQFSAGMRYRELYENSDPTRGLTPPDPDRSGGGGVIRRPFDEERGTVIDAGVIVQAQAHAQAAKTLAEMEEWVREQGGELPLKMLRAVAGECATIYELSDAGSRRKARRFTAALQTALGLLSNRPKRTEPHQT